MLLIYILAYTAITIYVVLPIRHKDSQYLYFFLLLSITALSVLIFNSVFNLQANNISLLLTIFLPFSLFYDFFKKYILILTIIFLLLIYPVFKLDSSLCLVLQYPFDVAVVFILFWQFSKSYLKENVINIFQAALLLFGLSEVLGMLGYVKNIDAAASVLINYIAVFLQIIIGLFLLIFSEKNPKLILTQKK
ncbi:MAG: hypothetical protein D8M61_08885 [Ignavibacteriae bacterium]|nr:hypothetical protein [Ignavibacteriota bacterium]